MSGTRRYVIVAAGVAAMAGLLFGHDTGVISGALLYLKKDFNLSSTMQEVVTASVLGGAVIGAAISGVISDALGRRRVILVMAVAFTIGSAGEALAGNLAWLIGFRTLVGMAIGVASFVAPMYNAEIAPRKIRGSLVSYNQLAITSGILAAYLLNDLFAPSGNWRAMFAVGIVPAVALGIGMLFLPESPRWLVDHGREDEARAILKRIHSDEDGEGQVETIRESLRKQHRAGWAPLFRRPLSVALWIGIGLAVVQQVTGINTVIYYAPTIFKFAGIKSSAAAIWATTGVGVVNVGMTIVAVWLVDRAGRRPLLLGGLAGMVVGLTALGLGFELGAGAGWLSTMTAASLMFYVAAFAIGLGPVFWLLISEIYPLRVRGRAMSLATIGNWGSNLLVTVTFLSISKAIGKGPTFWSFAGISVLGFLFCYLAVPETKHRSLEDITDAWYSEERQQPGRQMGEAHRA